MKKDEAHARSMFNLHRAFNHFFLSSDFVTSKESRESAFLRAMKLTENFRIFGRKILGRGGASWMPQRLVELACKSIRHQRSIARAAQVQLVSAGISCYCWLWWCCFLVALKNPPKTQSSDGRMLDYWLMVAMKLLLEGPC